MATQTMTPMMTRRTGYRFTPRQDLFPNDKPFVPEKPVETSKVNLSIVDPPSTNDSVKLSLMSNGTLHLSLMLLFLKLLSPRLWPYKSYRTTSSRNPWKGHLDNSDIISMLWDVSPYLNEAERENVSTFIGIMEAANILKDVKNRTYQAKNLSKTPVVAIDSRNKKLGIMKAVKNYIPDEKKELVDKIVKAHDAAEKLSKNIKTFNGNREPGNNQKQMDLENIVEVIKTLKPIIPDEYANKVEQMIKLFKIAEVMGNNSDLQVKNNELDGESNSKTDINKKTDTNNVTDTNNIMDTMQNMLGKDQSQSLEMMMKLAQLLAQSSNEEEKKEVSDKQNKENTNK